jgi:predicted dehydrogenase
VGVVDATTTAYPGYTERLELAGTLGSAVLEGERLTLQCKGVPVEMIDGSTSGGGGADPMAFSHEPHRRLIEDFVDAVREAREPMVSGRSALAVHALIDAMLESSQAGCAVEVGSSD